MASDGIDVSKVVRLIMENPHLIEEISNLAKSDGEESTGIAEKDTAESKPTSTNSKDPAPPPLHSSAAGQKSNRTMLLYALKPYVSKERGRAIDSIITIADVLDGMKRR